MNAMKAALYAGNKTFKIGESNKVKPAPNEVLLKVAHCGICGTDMHIYHGDMDQRISMPQVIGHEISAEVIETGNEVNNVTPGDHVAVRPLKTGAPVPSDAGNSHIGKNLDFMGIDTPGGMQAFWTVPAYTLHILPVEISLEHGAMIEPLAVACHDVRRAGIKPGEYCVIIGGGPIGMLNGLVAKQKGARVMISEVNSRRLELAKSLGMEGVNPSNEDIRAKVEEWTDKAYADAVFEVSGSAAGVQTMTSLTRARGRIIVVAIHPRPRPVNLFRIFWRELQLIGVRVYEPQDFDEAIRLVAANNIPLDALITEKAPIDHVQKTFELMDANPEGMKYLLRCS